MDLDTARRNIGGRVVYQPTHSTAVTEEGVITSVNDLFVFVCYTGDNHSKATSSKYLELVNQEEQA